MTVISGRSNRHTNNNVKCNNLATTTKSLRVCITFDCRPVHRTLPFTITLILPTLAVALNSLHVAIPVRLAVALECLRGVDIGRQARYEQR